MHSRWNGQRLMAKLNPGSRQRSILIDEQNPILQPAIYSLHKASLKRHTPSSRSGGQELENAAPSNPYFRMLASPIRQTVHDGQYSPSDFLIRLSIVQTPAPPTSNATGSIHYAIPDGLEHASFRGRTNWKGFYVPCWRDAFQTIVSSGRLKRVDPVAQYHSLLTAQISHQLRVRIIQELIIIGDKLSDPHMMAHTATPQVLRRLTRREWLDVKAGQLPLSINTASTVAILVVPKPRVPDDIASRVKSSWMDTVAMDPGVAKDASPKAFELLRTNTLLQSNNVHVPLYHGGAIFSRAEERMKLRLGLDRILGSERQGGWKPQGFMQDIAKIRGDPLDKASDAYVLYSSRETMRRIDTAPLAIALWRLRLWEGVGWTGVGSWGPSGDGVP
ncbi:hypothetical protein FRB93_005503 [Tulasnella sp. JGI-2019a]|nr:hypothetical protein FRB93_005503 [Tulasnella sp. JGI-2019a]